MNTERKRNSKQLATYVTEAVAAVVADIAASEGKTIAHWVREAVTEKAAKKPWENFEERGDQA